ncbi:MAG: SagB/ThcOx family dehydrogenase [Candidatus Caldatribacterium sp.]|uniref:SagB/ThcOx family dehydrogenase n=1 Tax=Candidatus Caldatribacterium sp. TaxID=2282143 RepID=UPI0029945CE0|nr:SagB/ThcOx family dehydrogenase [Candidatus Caldatribacterium sp.]MCX7729801.1 SagB/ThcOx family dehydrogenase [Candidatus Caldatribacterium sp.]MDW8081395.1 SagB/ThcOx family dehydrogenase [Candidatus Calescibacterium sp.]
MRFFVFWVVLSLVGCLGASGHAQRKIPLPPPRFRSEVSVEEALLRRRSHRSFDPSPLSLQEVAQLLWSAQGITDKASGFRTAPSAGALYPLELYFVAGQVESLPPGVYRYLPEEHALYEVLLGDRREELFRAALFQRWVREAPGILVFAAVYERTTRKYGERGIRYVHMEAGHAAQNVYLQAETLGLGTVVVGAFEDGGVQKALGLPAHEQPLYLMPVGRKKSGVG